MRGRPAVFSSTLLKVAGWNLLRAARVRELITKLTQGSKSGQSALIFLMSTRRKVYFNTLLGA